MMISLSETCETNLLFEASCPLKKKRHRLLQYEINCSRSRYLPTEAEALSQINLIVQTS